MIRLCIWKSMLFWTLLLCAFWIISNPKGQTHTTLKPLLRVWGEDMLMWCWGKQTSTSPRGPGSSPKMRWGQGSGLGLGLPGDGAVWTWPLSCLPGGTCDHHYAESTPIQDPRLVPKQTEGREGREIQPGVCGEGRGERKAGCPVGTGPRRPGRRTAIPHCLPSVQVLANGLDNKLREDLERLKKIRAHRGLRHFWGWVGAHLSVLRLPGDSHALSFPRSLLGMVSNLCLFSLQTPCPRPAHQDHRPPWSHCGCVQEEITCGLCVNK